MISDTHSLDQSLMQFILLHISLFNIKNQINNQFNFFIIIVRLTFSKTTKNIKENISKIQYLVDAILVPNFSKQP